MVGSTPDTSTVVNLHVPYHERLRNIFHLIFTYQLNEALPNLFFVKPDKSIRFVDHPDIMELVNTKTIVSIFRRTIIMHPVVFPHFHTFLTVQTKQTSVVGDKDGFVAIVYRHQETVVGVDLLRTITHLEGFLLFRIGVIAIEALFVELHPIILFRINKDTLHAVVESEILFQLTRSTTFKAFSYRIIDTVVHALCQP